MGLEGKHNTEHLNDLRKQIAQNSQHLKLYQELQRLFTAIRDCQELHKETDAEIKQMAEQEMAELQTELEE